MKKRKLRSDFRIFKQVIKAEPRIVPPDLRIEDGIKVLLLTHANYKNLLKKRIKEN